MKRSLIVFAILYCSQYIVSQNTYQKDSIMYTAAYKYILNDSINKDKLIVVSDSIEDLTRYWVTGLEQFPEECEKLAQYFKKQYFIESTGSYSPLLASLFHNQDVRHSTAILFFSEIVDLMLRADVHFYREYVGEDRFNYEAYMWGISYEYLFIFNKDGSIRKVLWRETILN